MGEQPYRSGTRPNARTNTARPYADIPRPITEADAHAEPPAERLMDETPYLVQAKPVGTLTRQIEYRTRTLTVHAVGLTLDTFYAALATENGGGHLFTISVGEHYLGEFVEVEFTNMTLDGFCDMLDKRLGVPS